MKIKDKLHKGKASEARFLTHPTGCAGLFIDSKMIAYKKDHTNKFWDWVHKDYKKEN